MSDYQDTSNLQQSIATAAGVSASDVTIKVEAASVIITATINVPTSTSVSAVQASLNSKLGTAADASAALGITVESDPTTTIKEPSTGGGGGDGGGAAAAVIIILCAPPASRSRNPLTLMHAPLPHNSLLLLVGGLWTAWYFRKLPKLGKHGVAIEAKLDGAWNHLKSKKIAPRAKVIVAEANVKTMPK